MLGFLLDFAESAGSTGAPGIMHYYTPLQAPVITSLARNFAVCDRWFASSPTQTLPNRSFAHTGTSNGKVNNCPYDPFDFNVRTIFNVLEDSGTPWAVYKDTQLHSLDKFCGTRVQFPQLWKLPDERFKHLGDFPKDLANGAFPKYSFLEPRLLFDGNDQHPPRDIRLGEELIYQIYEWIRQSGKTDILLVITYDEHGGCYDHMPPPFGAVPPDDHPGELGFRFDRYGVRVPAILVSPFIEPGAVFRSDTIADGHEVPFDHTSILATLRDWLPINNGAMLTSARIAQAPTFEHVLTLKTPRQMPTIDPPHKIPRIERIADLAEPSNDLQIALAMGLTRWADEVQGTKTAEDPTLPAKLKDRKLLLPHVMEEVRRIK
jgi:phospholipase C